MKLSSIIPNTRSRSHRANPQLNWWIRCILKTKYSAEAYYWLPENSADMIGQCRRPALNSSGEAEDAAGDVDLARISAVLSTWFPTISFRLLQGFLYLWKWWIVEGWRYFGLIMAMRWCSVNVVLIRENGNMLKWTSFDMNWGYDTLAISLFIEQVMSEFPETEV